MQRILLCLLFCTVVLGADSSTWATAVNGSFNAAANWGIFGLPVRDAFISAIGGPFTVTVDSSYTLLSQLTLGGNGSLPTLLIQGASLTVPTLNFLSGTIVVVNGALNSATAINVNTNGTVVLNMVNGTINTFLGAGISIANGQLQIIGQTTLSNAYSVASGATLLLSGIHAATSCQFTGAGTVALGSSGQLNLAGNNNCTINTNAFDLLGGYISSSGTAALNLGQMIISAANATIDGVTVTARSVSINNGTLSLIDGSLLQVQGNLNASIAASAEIVGNLRVLGQAYINTGNLILSEGEVAASASIAVGATLTLDSAEYFSGYIMNMGQLVIDGASSFGNSTANAVVVAGGQVVITSELFVAAGVTTFQNVSATGNATVYAGANFVINSANWTAARIRNSGKFVVNGTLNFLGQCLYSASNVQGQVSSQFSSSSTVYVNAGGLLEFSSSSSSTSNVEGNFDTSSGGSLNLSGNLYTSSKLNVNGAFNLVSGILTAVNGVITATQNITLTGASYLISSGNSTYGNISTQGSLVIQGTSQVIVQGSLYVGGSISVTSQGVVRVSRGVATAGYLTLSNSARYAVTVYNKTSSQVLNVVNNAQLSGTIQIDVDANLNLNAGDRALVLNYGAHTGAFTTVQVGSVMKRADQPDTVEYNDKNATLVRGNSTASTASSMSMSMSASVSGTVSPTRTQPVSGAEAFGPVAAVIVGVLALMY